MFVSVCIRLQTITNDINQLTYDYGFALPASLQ